MRRLSFGFWRVLDELNLKKELKSNMMSKRENMFNFNKQSIENIFRIEYHLEIFDILLIVQRDLLYYY